MGDRYRKQFVGSGKQERLNSFHNKNFKYTEEYEQCIAYIAESVCEFAETVQFVMT